MQNQSKFRRVLAGILSIFIPDDWADSAAKKVDEHPRKTGAGVGAVAGVWIGITTGVVGTLFGVKVGLNGGYLGAVIGGLIGFLVTQVLIDRFRR